MHKIMHEYDMLSKVAEYELVSSTIFGYVYSRLFLAHVPISGSALQGPSLVWKQTLMYEVEVHRYGYLPIF